MSKAIFLRTYTSIKSYLFVAVVFLLTGWEAKAQQKEKDSDGNEVVMDMRARQELIAFMDACKERSLGIRKKLQGSFMRY